MCGDDIAYLPCLHVLHNTCLMEYIKSKVDGDADVSCPLCREVHYRRQTQDYAFMKRVVYQTRDDQDETRTSDVFTNPHFTTHQNTPQPHVVIHVPRTSGPMHNETSSDMAIVKAMHKYRVYVITVVVIAIFTSLGIAIGAMV